MVHFDDGSWVKPGVRGTAGTSHATSAFLRPIHRNPLS